MSYDLNCDDIAYILKENLSNENQLKSIKSIFKNERFLSRIDYKPYFQRNYVWDKDKATYFIESILLGTEIPPIVLFHTSEINEVIDGRQRFETIDKFMKDELTLTSKGLKSLVSLSGRKYSQLSPNMQDSFENIKLRIIQYKVVNEPHLSSEKEDKIKKEIFKRYNSGIIPLKKDEIARAEFINDPISKSFKSLLEDNDNLFEKTCLLFLPKRRANDSKRDKINVLVSEIRNLITIPYIPIYNYASASSKQDLIKKFYFKFILSDNTLVYTDLFTNIINLLVMLREKLVQKKHFLSSNSLLYDTCYWCFYIVTENEKNITEEDLNNLVDYLMTIGSNPSFEILVLGNQEKTNLNLLFDQNNSHFKKSIINRYVFVSQYFSKVFKINMNKKIVNRELYKEVINDDTEKKEFNYYKLNKPDPSSVTIYDIMDDIKQSKFLIRPVYQREEVKNLQTASYLMESVLLGIKLPPIFIFKRKDRIKEVIDGQQRLLILIGFLGEKYLNENNEFRTSKKHLFSLSKLRILKELNGKNINSISEEYKSKILDFPLNIIEIDEDKNPEFESLDLFLRLNSKPYPIGVNSFEMWNAYINKDAIEKVKAITIKFTGKLLRPTDPRMKNEELITSLAYLHYKNKTYKIPNQDLLCIYIRNGRVCSRISKKADITKTLNEIMERDDISSFIESVNEVEKFLNKIDAIIDRDYDQLAQLFSHNYINKNFRTDQNFYFLWIIISKLSVKQINENRKEISSHISKKFDKIQNYVNDFTNPETINFDINEFVQELIY